MIKSFRGENHFLSNMYPCSVEYEGIEYTSAEKAFQAAKSLDPEVRKSCPMDGSPKVVKKWGKSIDLRPDWEEIKDQVMEDIVRAKFQQNEDLKKLLLETGDEELVEGNNWGDRYWGQVKGEGLNKLGKILMKVREELKNEQPENDK